MAKQKSEIRRNNIKPASTKSTNKNIDKAVDNNVGAIADKRKMKLSKEQKINVASITIFIILIFTLLVVVYPNYMRKVEALSMFISTPSYYHNCMALPGGLLVWLSTMLTQYMFVPWLGALILTVLLVLMQCLAIKAFAIPSRYIPATIILPVLCALAFLCLGYDIFTIKPQGIAFILPIGLIFSFLFYWGYRLIGNVILRSVIVLTVVLFGYRYFGFYALLTAVMFAGRSICDAFTKKSKIKQLIPAIISLVSVVVYPWYVYAYIGGDLMFSQIYISSLPRFYTKETGMITLYASIFVLVVLMSVFAGRIHMPKRFEAKERIVSYSIWLISICSLLLLRNNNTNFLTALDVDQAIWEQDWNRAVELSSKLDEEPTRLNTVLGYIANMRAGTLSNNMFGVKYGWKNFDNQRGGDPMHDAAGALLSYHTGLINYAYRWCTEYMIEQGMSVERLKMMVKCALLNYELDMASDYIDLLYNMPYHREWASRYQRYVKNPMLMSSDPELASISQLMCQTNTFVKDDGKLEGYIWPLLANAGEGTPQFNELSMQAALINRDLDAFMAKFPGYAQKHNRIPQTFQEAVLYWAQLAKAPVPIPIDRSVKENFNRFLSAFQSTKASGAEKQRDILAEQFGNTFWYYFVFTEDKPLM